MQQTSVQKENGSHNNKGGNIMFKQLKKRIKNEKGLTLIELLAVIVILAIIAAIAIPAVGNIIQNSRDKAVLSEASNLLSGAKIAITDNACGDANATTGEITCDATELSDFYEGDTTGASVVYDTDTRDYSITFPDFADIENTRFNVGLDATTNTMTEDELISNMDN